MKRRERYSIRSFFVMQGRNRRRIQRRIQRRRNTHAKSTGSRLLGGARVVVVVVVAFRTCFGFDALSPIACVAFVFFIRLNCTELTALKTGFCPSVSGT